MQDQWRIGHTSLFAYVLNLKPFKDVFWSNTDNDVFLCSDPNSTAGDGELPKSNNKKSYRNSRVLSKLNQRGQKLCLGLLHILYAINNFFFNI